MNEFFQMLKKDHEEVKGRLGQLKEVKDTFAFENPVTRLPLRGN